MTGVSVYSLTGGKRRVMLGGLKLRLYLCRLEYNMDVLKPIERDIYVDNKGN